MNRPPAVLWIGVVLLLLLPTAAGRLLLDLAGGVLLALLALPLILSGLGWIGWKLLSVPDDQLYCLRCNGSEGGCSLCRLRHSLRQCGRQPGQCGSPVCTCQ